MKNQSSTRLRLLIPETTKHSKRRGPIVKWGSSVNKYRVNISWEDCTSCFACVDVCHIICPECGQPAIIRHLEVCDNCGQCILVCPEGAITIEKKGD